MQSRELPLTEVRLDGNTQSREKLNKEAIEEYAVLYQTGVELPNLDVFHDGSYYWLAAGFHRFNGAGKAGKQTLRFNIHKGSAWDAFLFGIRDNVTNGVRRTNADKRYAVERILDSNKCDRASVRKIADLAAVSPNLVSDMVSERMAAIKEAEDNKESENAGSDLRKSQVSSDDSQLSSETDKTYENEGQKKLIADSPENGTASSSVEHVVDHRLMALVHCQRTHRDAKKHIHAARKLIVDLSQRYPHLRYVVGRIKKYLSDAATAIHQTEPVEWKDDEMVTRHEVQSRG